MRYRIVHIDDDYKILGQFQLESKLGWWDLFGWRAVSRHPTLELALYDIPRDKAMWSKIKSQPKPIKRVVYKE